MKNVISSDLVIGNFVIEAVGSQKFKIDLDDFYRFEVILSENLKKNNYYINISRFIINDFADEYPFFIESIDDNYINIIKSEEKFLKKMLMRYFRIGVPDFIVNEVQAASNKLLG